MTAVDTNLLVYAHREEMPWHQEASRCMRELAEGVPSWAIPWPCIHEFLAIVTHPKIFKTPSPMAVALAQLEAWMASPSVNLIAETPLHWETLKRTLTAGKVTGAMTHDARVVAICRQHGVKVLWSADRDFSRFAEIKVVNPLHT